MNFLEGRHQPQSSQTQALRQHRRQICVQDGSSLGKDEKGFQLAQNHYEFSEVPLGKETLRFSKENGLRLPPAITGVNVTCVRRSEKTLDINISFHL